MGARGVSAGAAGHRLRAALLCVALVGALAGKGERKASEDMAFGDAALSHIGADLETKAQVSLAGRGWHGGTHCY
jgi:hypothetical protein